MIGAIAGDIIGSIYERRGIKSTVFPLFSSGCRPTDDSVLTVAVAHAILDGGPYEEFLRSYYHRYPWAGFGGAFVGWARSPGAGPYHSWGNGSAMRVSPVAWAASTLEDALAEAARSAAPTHDHPEGVKGAQATAAALFLARTGAGKPRIRSFVEETFGYNLSFTIDAIRPGYEFDVSCQGSVPQAIRCFLEATDYEGAVRLAISLGGDSDTLACIAGSIAEAAWGVPPSIAEEALARLDDDLRAVVARFRARFIAS